MTKEKLWLNFLSKYPHFSNQDEQVKLNGTGLKQLFDFTFNQGFKEGYDKRSKENSIFEDIFGKMK